MRRPELTIDLKNSTMPVHLQFIEQGPVGKEFLAYMIVTWFAGSFLYCALLEASDFATNEKLHDSIIDHFANDYGWDNQDWQMFMLESMDSPHIKLID